MEVESSRGGGDSWVKWEEVKGSLVTNENVKDVPYLGGQHALLNIND